MNIKYKGQKGFTLIELLVVIAIIGILAGVVLTNLASSRNKAKDASVLEALSSMRNTMELYATGHDGNYGNAPSFFAGAECNIDDIGIDADDNGWVDNASVVQIHNNIIANGATKPLCTSGPVPGVSTSVAYLVVLPSGESTACTDSSGVLIKKSCAGGICDDNAMDAAVTTPTPNGLTVASCVQ